MSFSGGEAPADILDAYGNVLYPKGFRFRVLDYLPYFPHILVFDGRSPWQLACARRLKTRFPDLILLSTGGKVAEVRSALQTRVYEALPLLLERLGVEEVPSLIRRDPENPSAIRIETLPKEHCLKKDHSVPGA